MKKDLKVPVLWEWWPSSSSLKANKQKKKFPIKGWPSLWLALPLCGSMVMAELINKRKFN
jgi:hypothetical protein